VKKIGPKPSPGARSRCSSEKAREDRKGRQNQRKKSAREGDREGYRWKETEKEIEKEIEEIAKPGQCAALLVNLR
jgi:hypothetical protein